MDIGAAMAHARTVMSCVGNEYMEAMADGKVMTSEACYGLADTIDHNGYDLCLRRVDPAELGKDKGSKIAAATHLLFPFLTAMYQLCKTENGKKLGWYNGYLKTKAVILACSGKYMDAMSDGKLMLTEFLRGLGDVLVETGNDMCLREVNPDELEHDTPSKVLAGSEIVLPFLTAMYALCSD